MICLPVRVVMVEGIRRRLLSRFKASEIGKCMKFIGYFMFTAILVLCVSAACLMAVVAFLLLPFLGFFALVLGALSCWGLVFIGSRLLGMGLVDKVKAVTFLDPADSFLIDYLLGRRGGGFQWSVGIAMTLFSARGVSYFELKELEANTKPASSSSSSRPSRL